VLKVGIIGCGSIGLQLCRFLQKHHDKRVQVAYLSDINQSQLTKAVSITRSGPQGVGIVTLIKKSDLIIECATKSIVPQVVEIALRENKSILVMSVGGLLDARDLFKWLKKSKGKLYIPSGAVAGIDGIKAAEVGKISSIQITTRKPPIGLQGAPYLRKKNIDVTRFKSAQTVFQGSAKQAIAAFPENINVAALVSLVGIGPNKTKVTIVCDPKVKCNQHVIEVIGSTGKLRLESENTPSKENPKTSQLAINSAIVVLEEILDNVRFGT